MNSLAQKKFVPLQGDEPTVTKEEMAELKLDVMVEQIYADFVQVVADSRELSPYRNLKAL